jgi:G patch domain-containing protein 1
LYLGFAYEQTEVDIEPSKTSDGNYKLDGRKTGLSFKVASNSEYKLER